jgi:hypothetical protein
MFPVWSGLADPVELSGDTDAGDRVVSNRGRTFPAKIINDAQNAEPAAINQRIGHKIQ